MLEWIARTFMKPRWVVNLDGDLGLRVMGVNFWYYKRPEALISSEAENAKWRVIEAREFGVTIRTRKCASPRTKEEGRQLLIKCLSFLKNNEAGIDLKHDIDSYLVATIE